MASEPRGAVLVHLRKLFQQGTANGLSEWQLLRRYLARQDEAAFEAIVARHGPMVLGVCRRVLHDPRDVEDAFQATFLVLVRRAGGLGEGVAIGPWLHGVAHRVSLRARAVALKRRLREQPANELDVPAPAADLCGIDLAGILDEELTRLPAKYRAPIVLCYLQGETHEEASRRLGWPIGTVKGRLVRARELLKGRLTRRGLTLSAGALVASLSHETLAVLPETLRAATIKAVVRSASGRAAAASVSSTVAALTEGVLTTMFLTKLKSAAVALTALSALACVFGAGAMSPRSTPQKTAVAADTAKPPVDREVKHEPSPPKGDLSISTTPSRAAGREDNRGPSQQELMHHAYDEALAAYVKHKVDVDKVYFWSKRILDAELVRAEEPYEFSAAFETHLKRMQDLRHRVHLRKSSGNELSLNLAAAEFYLKEAVDLLNEYEDVGEKKNGSPDSSPALSITARKPESGEKSSSRTASERSTAVPQHADWGSNDPRSRAVLATLEKPVDMSFPNDTPLEEVLDHIREETKGPDFPNGLPIYVDPVGLQEAEKTLTSTIQIDLVGVPLRRTLHLALSQLGLVYTVGDGILYITSQSSEESILVPTQPSRLVELQFKLERGELSEDELDTLLGLLKARIEVAKLRRELEEAQSRHDPGPH